MASILGTGRELPAHIVKNEELLAFMDTSDAWIQQRTGICERRWIREGNREFIGPTNASMGATAGKKALQRASIAPEQIGLLVYVTISPDQEFPGSAVAAADHLGLSESVQLIEVRNHCTGFLYGLEVARLYIDAGLVSHALVVGSEILSSGQDLSTRGRGTAILFGDGAGAVVLGPGQGIIDLKLHSDGSFAEVLGVEAPGFARAERLCAADFSSEGRGEADPLPVFPRMEGQLVFKNAVVRMPQMVEELLGAANLTLADIALIVPHQANQRILDVLAKQCGAPEKIFGNINRYGNTTGASIPIALDEAYDLGRIKTGDKILLVGFGAGFSWGGALLQW